jgi:hypothetical protein
MHACAQVPTTLFLSAVNPPMPAQRRRQAPPDRETNLSGSGEHPTSPPTRRSLLFVRDQTRPASALCRLAHLDPFLRTLGGGPRPLVPGIRRLLRPGEKMYLPSTRKMAVAALLLRASCGAGGSSLACGVHARAAPAASWALDHSHAVASCGPREGSFLASHKIFIHQASCGTTTTTTSWRLTSIANLPMKKGGENPSPSHAASRPPLWPTCRKHRGPTWPAAAAAAAPVAACLPHAVRPVCRICVFVWSGSRGPRGRATHTRGCPSNYNSLLRCLRGWVSIVSCRPRLISLRTELRMHGCMQRNDEALAPRGPLMLGYGVLQHQSCMWEGTLPLDIPRIRPSGFGNLERCADLRRDADQTQATTMYHRPFILYATCQMQPDPPTLTCASLRQPPVSLPKAYKPAELIVTQALKVAYGLPRPSICAHTIKDLTILHIFALLLYRDNALVMSWGSQVGPRCS